MRDAAGSAATDRGRPANRGREGGRRRRRDSRQAEFRQARSAGEAMQSNRLLGTERNAPPHFAGRTDELNRLAGYAEYIFRNSDPSDGIVLIDGVPGSGKTQLMRRFVERQQAGGAGVLTLSVTTADIPEDAKSLMFLIASAMPVGRRRALGIAGEERRAKSLSFAGIGKLDWDNPTAPDLPITEMLRLSKDTGWWKDQSMIVGIDEIQTLERVEQDHGSGPRSGSISASHSMSNGSTMSPWRWMTSRSAPKIASGGSRQDTRRDAGRPRGLAAAPRYRHSSPRLRDSRAPHCGTAPWPDIQDRPCIGPGPVPDSMSNPIGCRGARMDYRRLITIEPGKRAGKPCIRGMRITVMTFSTICPPE